MKTDVFFYQMMTHIICKSCFGSVTAASTRYISHLWAYMKFFPSSENINWRLGGRWRVTSSIKIFFCKDFSRCLVTIWLRLEITIIWKGIFEIKTFNFRSLFWVKTWKYSNNIFFILKIMYYTWQRNTYSKYSQNMKYFKYSIY